MPEGERCFFEVWPATGRWRPSFDIDCNITDSRDGTAEAKAELLQDSVEGIVAFLQQHYHIQDLTSKSFQVQDGTTPSKFRCAPPHARWARLGSRS